MLLAAAEAHLHTPSQKAQGMHTYPFLFVHGLSRQLLLPEQSLSHSFPSKEATLAAKDWVLGQGSQEQ